MKDRLTDEERLLKDNDLEKDIIITESKEQVLGEINRLLREQDAKTARILIEAHKKEIEGIKQALEELPLGLHHQLGLDHYDEHGNEVMVHQPDCIECQWEKAWQALKSKLGDKE